MRIKRTFLIILMTIALSGTLALASPPPTVFRATQFGSALVSAPIPAKPVRLAPQPPANRPPILEWDAIAPWDPRAFKLDDYFSGLKRSNSFSGVVLVAQKNQVILAKGYGYADKATRTANTLTTKFRIASLSKQFAAAAILNLQAQGKLNVRDRICVYLAHCPATWEPITIHQLLTHTSGIRNFAEFRDFYEFFAVSHTTDQVLTRLQETALDFSPGTKFHYSNSGYYLLGAIVEQIAGMPYEQFLRREILDPLGMKDTGTSIDNASLATGYPIAYVTRPGVLMPFDISNSLGNSDLYSTVLDMYTWVQALDRWARDPHSKYHAMFEPYVPGEPQGSSYGYGLTIDQRFGQKVISHTGEIFGYSSMFTHYLDSGITEILLSNDESLHIVFIEPQMAKMALGLK